jgi:hypothetical protein
MRAVREVWSSRGATQLAQIVTLAMTVDGCGARETVSTMECFVEHNYSPINGARKKHRHILLPKFKVCNGLHPWF